MTEEGDISNVESTGLEQPVSGPQLEESAVETLNMHSGEPNILPTVRVQMPQPMRKAKLTCVETDTEYAAYGVDKGIAAEVNVAIVDPEVHRRNNLNMMVRSVFLRPLVAFAFSEKRRDSLSESTIQARLLDESSFKSRGSAFMLTPGENHEISQFGVTQWPRTLSGARDLIQPNHFTQLVTPVDEVMKVYAKRWYDAFQTWARKSGIRGAKVVSEQFKAVFPDNTPVSLLNQAMTMDIQFTTKWAPTLKDVYYILDKESWKIEIIGALDVSAPEALEEAFKPVKAEILKMLSSAEDLDDTALKEAVKKFCSSIKVTSDSGFSYDESGGVIAQGIEETLSRPKKVQKGSFDSTERKVSKVLELLGNAFSLASLTKAVSREGASIQASKLTQVMTDKSNIPVIMADLKQTVLLGSVHTMPKGTPGRLLITQNVLTWKEVEDGLDRKEPFYFISGRWYIVTFKEGRKYYVSLDSNSGEGLGALLRTSGEYWSALYVDKYRKMRAESDGLLYGGLHSSVEQGRPLAPQGEWAGTSVLPIVSDAYYLQPGSVEVEAEGTIRIRDFIIAYNIARLFPGTKIKAKDIGLLPETEAELEAWRKLDYVTPPIDEARDADVEAAWPVIWDILTNMRLKGMDRMETSLITKDPRLDLVIARQWIQDFAKSLEGHEWIVYNGCISRQDKDFVEYFMDETLQKLLYHLKVLQSYFTPDQETLKLTPRQPGVPDQRINQLDEWADALQSLIQVLNRLPVQQEQFTAMSRYHQVKSLVLDRFTILSNPVRFRVPYTFADLGSRIKLPNFNEIDFLHPTTLGLKGVDSLVRMNVNAHPRAAIEHGLAGDTKIRSQRSSIDQVRVWTYIPLIPVISRENFEAIRKELRMGLNGQYYLPQHLKVKMPKDGKTESAENKIAIEEMALRTCPGRVTSLLNMEPVLSSLGVAGMVFPLNAAIASNIDHLSINNSFSVKVTAKTETGSIDSEYPLLVGADGTLDHHLQAHFELSVPDTPIYARPRQISEE